MASRPPYLVALDEAASTRSTVVHLQDYSNTRLEALIKRQARDYETKLVENARLRERVELLEGLLEQRDSDIEVLWEEVGTLSQQLHPQGHWQFEPGRDEIEGRKEELEEEVERQVSWNGVKGEMEVESLANAKCRRTLQRFFIDGVLEDDDEEEEEDWKGHWTWNMDTYQRRVVKHIPPPSDDPPPSLQNLPTEINEMILALLSRTERLSLAQVSFQYLALVARDLYRAPALDQTQAQSFVLSRLSPSRNRIRRVLTPRTLVLRADMLAFDQDLTPFSNLLALTPSCYPPIPPISNGVEFPPLPFTANPTRPSIPLPKVSLAIDGFQDEFTLWFPLLQILNPHTFQISTISHPANRTAIPTLTPVPGSHVDALCDGWDRLQCVIGCGVQSVPMAWSGEMAFSGRLERNRPEGRERKETFVLRTHFHGELRQEEEGMLSWDELVVRYDDTRRGPVIEVEERKAVSYESLVMRAWGDAKREGVLRVLYF